MSGAGEHCKVFDDNTNQYLIDQWILIGGMLCFEVTPISSSQARVVHCKWLLALITDSHTLNEHNLCYIEGR